LLNQLKNPNNLRPLPNNKAAFGYFILRSVAAPHQFEVGFGAILGGGPASQLPHLVVRGRQVLQEFWGGQYSEESDYVWTFVQRIRRKVEPDRAHPRYVLTEPGFGYCMPAPEDAYLGLLITDLADRVPVIGALLRHHERENEHSSVH
jgi:hypothetical protein